MQLRRSAMLLMTMLSTSPAFAMCWNAQESGEPGMPVEICRNGRCEVTEKIFECANADGLRIGYQNGLSVEQDLRATPPVTIVTENGRRLTPQEIAALTCNDIAGMGACAFDLARAPTDADITTQIAQIRQQFESAMGIDAENLQVALLEAGIFTGTVDGTWGPDTEQAFIEALKIAQSYGFSPNLDDDSALYKLANAVRNWKFDPDSGLSRLPFAGAHLLVVASRKTASEAYAVQDELAARMNAVNLPNRAGVFPTLNGWFATTAGMYSKAGCLVQADRLKAQGVLPPDAYCAAIERFDPMAWTN